MKIKAKLFLGIGVLFAMIVALTALSGIFINKLSGDVKNILISNYQSLDYSREMLLAINDGPGKPSANAAFQNSLAKQVANVTEPGEQAFTNTLSAHYAEALRKPSDSTLIRHLQTDITNIMQVNMQAIQRKSTVAEKSADDAIFWTTTVGTLCFLMAFVLLLNLPGNISNPIKALTRSIREIAAGNYLQRVHLDTNNEFGELARAFNTMAQKLEEFKAGNLEKLLIEKKRIETLINNMTDPVIGLDENKHILFMNDMALKITGLQDETVIGVRVQDIAVHNDLVRSLIQDLFEPASTDAVPARSSVKIYANNKESYFEKEIIPIKIIPAGELQEKLIGNVIRLQNITSYKELDFAKTNFIATVSHELKTPIAAIKMSLQLLAKNQVGTLNADQQGLLDSIRDDTARLLKITGELLNMAQVETGTIQLSVVPAAAKTILDYALAANKTAAEQKQIELLVSIAEGLSNVMADTEKTAWVLTNLISNAIRYSYHGAEVALRVSQQNGHVRFEVKDTGQGIATQYQDKIFERYFRVPGTRKEGTGLGLSISREFIEAQGGTLMVKSELGAGSSFFVELPAEK